MADLYGFPFDENQFEKGFNPDFLPNTFYFDSEGNVTKSEHQPERSKREDSDKIDVNTRAWKERQEWNRRCGTLNIVETQ